MSPDRDEATRSRLQSRRNLLEVGLLGGAGVLLAGGGIAASLAEAVSAHAKGSAANQTPTRKRTGNLYKVIATPDMLGTNDMPAYMAAYPAIPSNATVRVEIVDFDDATPLTGGLTQFAKVAGTVGGTITVTPLNPQDPNTIGASQVFSELDPQNVSHTFTVAGLGINIPVAPKARTVFAIATGTPGSYAWRCNDPCGIGASGWGGAMAKPGYMMGKLTLE
jgi:hypothetical protein